MSQLHSHAPHLAALQRRFRLGDLQDKDSVLSAWLAKTENILTRRSGETMPVRWLTDSLLTPVWRGPPPCGTDSSLLPQGGRLRIPSISSGVVGGAHTGCTAKGHACCSSPLGVVLTKNSLVVRLSRRPVQPPLKRAFAFSPPITLVLL